MFRGRSEQASKTSCSPSGLLFRDVYSCLGLINCHNTPQRIQTLERRIDELQEENARVVASEEKSCGESDAIIRAFIHNSISNSPIVPSALLYTLGGLTVKDVRQDNIPGHSSQMASIANMALQNLHLNLVQDLEMVSPTLGRLGDIFDRILVVWSFAE
jgi:hypothetical protein